MVPPRTPFDNVQLKLAAFAPVKGGTAEDLHRFFLREATEFDACLILVGNAYTACAEAIRTAAHVVSIDEQRFGGSLKNGFHAVLSKALKSLYRNREQFARHNDAQLLTLPLRNFAAPELVEIARLQSCESGKLILAESIERQMVRLRRRVRPRKRTAFNTRYAVDENNRFFSFGHERHGAAATDAPHLPSCTFAARFRFGIRIDEQRHFNVSETEGDITHVSGDFIDCHDQPHCVASGEKLTHLNMHANDYFGR